MEFNRAFVGNQRLSRMLWCNSSFDGRQPPRSTAPLRMLWFKVFLRLRLRGDACSRLTHAELLLGCGSPKP